MLTTKIPTIVHSDPEILGGTPVFVGTRVPVRTLFDYLAAGDTLEEFLDRFPTVCREQAVAALRQANELLVTHVAVYSRSGIGCTSETSRGYSAKEIQALLQIDLPPADDATVEQWIDEHRMEKHGT